MKKITLVFLALIPLFLFAQQKPAFVGQWYQRTVQGNVPSKVDFFSLGPSDFSRTKKYNLKANAHQLNSILRTAPALVDLEVPYGDKVYTLNLARVEVTTPDMAIRLPQGNAKHVQSVQYRGIVNNNPEHIASLSISITDITGFFSTAEGNFVITKEGLELILYNQQEIAAPGIVYCNTSTDESLQIPVQSQLVTGIGCKTVNVYFECDYALYQAKGSNINAVADYVLGFFNQVATLYANENVAIQISEMFVWTTPDPYVSMTNTSTILGAFRTNRGTGFNGNLAHFISTRNLGGGVAYVDVLCNKAYAYGVSQIYSTYNNLPTYSWTVEVVAHELGHNLGSPHTHSCSWSVGALDNCYTPEGSCATGPAPSGGGTVMSYCHLTSTGINFNNGFGFHPGNRIRDRVLNATCITGGATTAPTSLSTSSVTANSATLNWAAVSGATNYTVQYREVGSPSYTSAGSTTLTKMILTGLSASTGYEWTVKSDCSGFAATNSFTTTVSTTGCNAPGQLSSTAILQTAATLSWSAVIGAKSYIVQYRPSSSSTWNSVSVASNTTNLSSLQAGTSYTWQVKADCSAYSALASFTTSPATVTVVCDKAANLVATPSGNNARLSWTGTATAQSYTVRIREVGATNWTEYNTSDSFLNFKTKPRRSYEWMVNTTCTGGGTSGFTPVSLF